MVGAGSGSNQNPVAVVNLVLDDLGGKAGEGFPPGLEGLVLILHFDGCLLYTSGYQQAVCAIQLALEEESRLRNVTKEIYWVVADAMGCARSDIERNLRTLLSLIHI